MFNLITVLYDILAFILLDTWQTHFSATAELDIAKPSLAIECNYIEGTCCLNLSTLIEIGHDNFVQLFCWTKLSWTISIKVFKFRQQVPSKFNWLFGFTAQAPLGKTTWLAFGACSCDRWERKKVWHYPCVSTPYLLPLKKLEMSSLLGSTLLIGNGSPDV